MAQFNFGKSYHLLSSEDFNYLKSGSKKVYLSCIRAYYKKSRLNLSNTRIGLSVSKKVGNAVIRNRVKRICREKFRLSNARDLSLDVLVVVSPYLFKNHSFTEGENKLRAELDELFSILKSKAHEF